VSNLLHLFFSLLSVSTLYVFISNTRFTRLHIIQQFCIHYNNMHVSFCF
jgi:hypothetical protein